MKQFTIIGHVDTGKSTLGGRILVETKTVEWDQKKSLASFLDIYEEEQIKSKTHEWSAYEFEYNNQLFRMIDTPGHKIYIRSMIEAISKNPTDTALVVLSARSNEFDSSFKNGQTKEDLLLARATGHENLIIAINKIDTIEDDDTINQKIMYIQEKIQSYTKQLKFKNIVLCPVSAITGQGIDYLLNSIEKYSVEKNGDKNHNDESIKRSDSCEMIQTNTVKMEFAYVRNDLLISGTVSIAHINGKEYNVELMCKERFIKKPGKYTITIRFLDTVVNVHHEQKIILRHEQNTLGFGKICGIKPLKPCNAKK